MQNERRSPVSDREVFSLGDSSCRPPGDGQETSAVGAEHDVRQGSGRDPSRAMGHCFKEASCSCKHQVCSKMKKSVEGERGSEPLELSKHASSSSYLQWAKDMYRLLDDPQGLDLFQRFLVNENCSPHSLHFWLAIRGLYQKKCTYDPVQLGKLVKVIYKRYIKVSVVTLNKVTKQDICNKIGKSELYAEIFDKARVELEETVLHTLYTNFLKSDLYLQYLQKMQNGPQTDDSCRQSESSGSNSSTGSHNTLDIMPTVPEESELQIDCKSYPSASVLSVPKDTYRHRSSGGGTGDPMRFSNIPPYMTVPKNRYSSSPYAKYSSYLPPSAQDSDRQSLSSDAHTEDTMSVSDLDTVPVRPSKTHSKYERTMRKNAHLNSENNELQPIIPRTHRLQNPYTEEATKNPNAFAEKLMNKLSQIEQYQRTCERLEQVLKSNVDDGSTSRLPFLWTATMQDKMLSSNESDQLILDQHVSRVWDDSLHQSPINQTPGQYSPPLRPADHQKTLPPKMHAPLNLIGASSRLRNYDAHNNPPHCVSRNVAHHRHRKDRDACSTDSGNVKDMTPDRDQATYSEHRHHHHHHQLQADNPAAEQTQVSGNVGSSSSRRTRDSGPNSRRNSQKKLSLADSGSSCVDSGVSVCDPVNPAVRDKVYNWLANEEYSCTQGPNSEKDSLSHHKKSTHSSLSNSSGNQSKQRSGANSKDKSSHLEIIHGRSSSNKVPELSEEKLSLRKQSKRSSSVGVANSGSERLASVGSVGGGGCGGSSTGPSAAPSLMGGSSSASAGEQITACYCFAGEKMPYLTKLPGKNITFKQFKTIITKRGNFRFFFKTTNSEFGQATVVQEEVKEDNAFVPMWEGKIFCTIEPIPEP